MTLYPEDIEIPAGLTTPEFILRPLRSIHNDRDYDAVMSSREMLLMWGRSDWPAEDFTLRQNLDDLIRHESEHIDRVAFTYTVMNPAESTCLGCVYIRPLRALLTNLGAEVGAIESVDARAAVVSFWVRQKRLDDDLDKRLLGSLIDWFGREWQFSSVSFRSNSDDTRQTRLFELAGLRRLRTIALPDKSGHFYIYG
ncbi:MAG: hypothetical protein JSV52_00380 [Candidatus Zixiibacteriota bacterium]|nr:MAG: hypothetical protein JSV52_00380 [candidate division Zixibacteria bacterium]